MECDILDFSGYGNEADKRSDALLKKALEGYGNGARIVRLTREGIATALVKRVWLRYDLRSMADLTFVVGVAETLTRSGHVVFPEPLSITKSEDKWESYLTLKAYNIPTVETFPIEEFSRSTGPAVIKPRVGWGGMGMKVIPPCTTGEGSLPGANGDYVWQPFVDHSLTWTAVIGDTGSEVLLEKRAKPGDFRTNSRFGEKARLADDSGEVCLLARKALSAFGLAAGTVDLIKMEGRAAIVEINSAPCLWYDELPDLDVAGIMGRAVMDWFNGQRECE